MEDVGSAAARVGAVWLALVLALIVVPSALGVSLGISEAYMWVLMKTLEWATIRIEKGVKKPQPQILKTPAANEKEGLKGAGTGCPHVLKDELVGKKTSLAEQRALAGTQEKKRVYDLWKKGQATQEDYKDVVRKLEGPKPN
ncbi:hypothetical protein QYF61_017264 [Mycteria americana]|uniref:Uncharacterized protein n=1 Tax=Mycteria americana TaxID=33587 RepID=A0AAN7S3X6_MYCAM|nr:hypothetical protein QYF61_017264 [Mycteria americana]